MKTERNVTRMWRGIAHPEQAESRHQRDDSQQFVFTIADNVHEQSHVGTVDADKASVAIVNEAAQRFSRTDYMFNCGKHIAVQKSSGGGATAFHACVQEFGPYENGRDARGGYFAVDGWYFHWFEGERTRDEPAPWLKTREQARDAALALAGALAERGQ